MILDDSLFGATKQADSATDYFNSRFWDAGDPRNLAGACGWSPLTEGLRVTLAVTVCLLFVRCGDIFFLSNTDNHKMGTLALCAYYMFQEMLYNWMPLMCLVAMAWGIALSILSPRLTGSDVDVDSPLGDASATLARSAGIDFSPSGPFFAPFWGFLDMWFAPDKLTDLQESSVFTPFAVWSYLLINLVLFINLLIAMFNRTYEDVISRSKEEMRFHSAQDLYRHFTMYPVPPPFNIPVLFIDFVVTQCLQWRRWRSLLRRVVSRRKRKSKRESEEPQERWKPFTLIQSVPPVLRHYPDNVGHISGAWPSAVSTRVQHIHQQQCPLACGTTTCRFQRQLSIPLLRSAPAYALLPFRRSSSIHVGSTITTDVVPPRCNTGEAAEIELQRAKERYFKKVKFDEWRSESRQHKRIEDLNKLVNDRFDKQEAAQTEVRSAHTHGPLGARVDEAPQKKATVATGRACPQL